MSEPLSRGLLLRFLKEALKGDESGSQSRLVASALNKMSDAGLLTLPPDRGAGDGAATAIAENPYLEKLVAECNTFLVFQGIIVPRPAVPPDGRNRTWNPSLRTRSAIPGSSRITWPASTRSSPSTSARP
jgi:hypothetical protein